MKYENSWLAVVKLIEIINKKTPKLRIGKVAFQDLCYLLAREGVYLNVKFLRKHHGVGVNNYVEMLEILKRKGYITVDKVGKGYDIRASLYLKDELNDIPITYKTLSNKVYFLLEDVSTTEEIDLMTSIIYLYDKHRGISSIEELYDTLTEWRTYYRGRYKDICKCVDKLNKNDCICVGMYQQQRFI